MPDSSIDSQLQRVFEVTGCKTPGDLAVFAETLQEMAKALSALAKGNASKAADTAAIEFHKLSDGGETRTFYFPREAVNREKELLRSFHKEDLPGVLDALYTTLAGLAKVMQSVRKETGMKGSTLISLGMHVQQAAGTVVRLRDIYAKVALLE